MRIRNILKRIAFVLAFAVVIVAVCLLARSNAKHFETMVVNQTQQHLLTIAKTQAKNVEDVVSGIQAELQILAENPAIQQAIISNDSTDNVSAKSDYSLEDGIFERLSRLSVQVSGLYRLDAYGIVQNRIPFKKDRIGVDFSHKPGVGTVMKSHKPYISEMFKANSGQYGISICYPVFDDRTFIGIVRTAIYLNTITDMLNRIKIGQKGYAWIIDDDEITVVHPKPKYIGKDTIATRKEAFPDNDWSELENIVARMTGGEEG
ncbi:MAG TPA: hypothetical protein ENH43_00400, partial [Phycisphaerales bacterium]|nr:hypothetical protein [Phycisphaerales bacterium]